jgi:hypothetical protein
MAYNLNQVATFPPKTEITCSECGETKGTTNDMGWLPKGWQGSMAYCCDRNGNLFDGKAVATCPACLNLQDEMDREDEIEQACDALRDTYRR